MCSLFFLKDLTMLDTRNYDRDASLLRFIPLKVD